MISRVSGLCSYTIPVFINLLQTPVSWKVFLFSSLKAYGSIQLYKACLLFFMEHLEGGVSKGDSKCYQIKKQLKPFGIHPSNTTLWLCIQYIAKYTWNQVVEHGCTEWWSISCTRMAYLLNRHIAIINTKSLS